MKTANMALMSVAVLGLGLLGITSVSFNDVSQASSLSSPESGAILGHMEAIHKDPNGNILSYSQTDNIVVDEGRVNMALLTFGVLNQTGLDRGTGEVFNVIGLRVDDASTPIPGETYAASDHSQISGLAPKEIDGNDGLASTNCTDDSRLGASNVGTVHLSCTFTAGGVDTIYGASILNNGTTSHVYAAKNFTGNTSIDLNTDDQLTIVWEISWTNS